jgi:beta-N-acetylhexosaminidase
MAYQTTNSTLNKRQFLKLTVQSMATMPWLTACTLSPEIEMPMSSNTTISQNEKPDSQQNLADNAKSEISLEAKIGQMLLVGFRGLQIMNDHAPIVHDIQEHHIGGVVLFNYDVAQRSPERNIQSPEQLKTLVRTLQSYSKIPLFIGIDYEGGKVNRLPEAYGFPKTVSHHYLGSENDLSLTKKYATIMAKTLYEMGINLNFAPVVDLNINPENPIIGKIKRSFSSNPKIVTQHALEFIRAHRQQNVLCTLKHFPGHGSSRADSHLGIADVSKTWKSVELQPYIDLIEANEAESIMTAHVFNKQLDPNYPATLSYQTITERLRGELNFNGLIFSDDMQMKAISKYYGLKTAVHKAIEAGIDILVIGNNTGDFVPDIVKRVTIIIKELVEQGTLSEARINESYQRIIAVKKSLLGGF